MGGLDVFVGNHRDDVAHATKRTNCGQTPSCTNVAWYAARRRAGQLTELVGQVRLVRVPALGCDGGERRGAEPVESPTGSGRRGRSAWARVPLLVESGRRGGLDSSRSLPREPRCGSWAAAVSCVYAQSTSRDTDGPRSHRRGQLVGRGGSHQSSSRRSTFTTSSSPTSITRFVSSSIRPPTRAYATAGARSIWMPCASPSCSVSAGLSHIPTRNDDIVWPSTRIVGPKLRISATPSVGHLDAAHRCVVILVRDDPPDHVDITAQEPGSKLSGVGEPSPERRRRRGMKRLWVLVAACWGWPRAESRLSRREVAPRSRTRRDPSSLVVRVELTGRLRARRDDLHEPARREHLRRWQRRSPRGPRS